MPPKRNSQSAAALNGLVFAITGTLSVSRAQFEKFITDHGGSVAKTVTNACTHLVSAETGTKKCQDAEAKGVAIVDEQWVRNCVEGNGSAAVPAAPVAAAAPAAAAKPKAAAKKSSASLADIDEGIFSGINFNVTGTAEYKQPLEDLIVSNGGNLVSIGGECRYLVCEESAMAKLRAIATAKNIQLVSDQWVLDKVVEGQPIGASSSSSSSSAPAAPAAAAPVAAALPAKKAAPAAKASSASSGPGLSGMCFCITGTLSVSRADFEALIVKNGGTVAKSITNACTHLVSAETGTKKCQDAEAKGVEIVDEDWVRERLSSSSSSSAATPAAATAKPAAKRGKKAAEPEPKEEEQEESEEEEQGGSFALEGMIFAITGTLSVSRAEFEKFIKEHGGNVVKSVTNTCTHLVSSETGTKKCQDAEDKGVKIVTEEWVRNRVAQDDVAPGEVSFTPRHDFVNELIETDEDEGRVKYQGGKVNVGKIVWNCDEFNNWEGATMFKIHSFSNGMYVLKQVDDPSVTEEVDENQLADTYYTQPPPHVLNRWERFQQRPISEGIWREKGSPELIAEINECVDAFSAQEPVDFHPGTRNVVRDLVHPSLYPLILKEGEVDVTKKNHWGRSYEKSRFQWLPAEVEIDETGTAKFVSPINNLDSEKYPALQHAMEKVFTTLVPGLEKVWGYAQKLKFNEEQDDWEEEYPDIPPVSFKNTTLQVVPKIADYTFEPDASFSGVWHYEGMAHENIVMTGLFYPSSDDRLGGGLEFKRQFTDVEAHELLFGVAQCRPTWLDEIISQGFVPLGQTTTETGSLLVFPNCHAHRVLEMVNKTNETLRRRLIVFFVVDPNTRIISSKDRPPMPRTVSLETALADRLELMQERKHAKQDLNPREIELCEH